MHGLYEGSQTLREARVPSARNILEERQKSSHAAMAVHRTWMLQPKQRRRWASQSTANDAPFPRPDAPMSAMTRIGNVASFAPATMIQRQHCPRRSE